MKTFVAQCQEDYDTLNRNINDNQVLGRKVWVTTWYRARMDRLFVPPPMERDEVCVNFLSEKVSDVGVS